MVCLYDEFNNRSLQPPPLYLSNNHLHNSLFSVPITFIYGEFTWMDISMGEATKAKLPNSRIQIFTVPRAGHHVICGKAKFSCFLVHVMIIV